MMDFLKARIIESDQPVGVKKVSNWKLPPKEFSYGYSSRQEEEGVSQIMRSWLVHQPSKTTVPPQDFVRINKLAVKMNAVNYNTNKDFRESIDIKQVVKKGSKVRNVKLPPKDFSYGMRSGSSAPVREIITNEFGNKAVRDIKQGYDELILKRNQSSKLVPKNNKHMEKLIQLRKSAEHLQEKPLYKHKMFRNVGSKVTENLKIFKTYHEEPKRDLDCLIEQVQREIQTKQTGIS